MGLSIVVLQHNPTLAQSLAGELRSHFPVVHLTHSRDELREKMAKARPEAIVLDMECSHLSDVQNLHLEFPSVPIVCTHRIPDEDLWMAALDAGAADVCAAGDVDDVLTSVLRSLALSRTAAA
jgi:chemotaxis response regulator CheB